MSTETVVQACCNALALTNIPMEHTFNKFKLMCLQSMNTITTYTALKSITYCPTQRQCHFHSCSIEHVILKSIMQHVVQ